jgi:uridine kinase
MFDSKILQSQDIFSEHLMEAMKPVAPVIKTMELYEFRYCLNNIVPENCDWSSVKLEPIEEIEKKISSREFFDNIQIKPKVDGRIVLDTTIENLTQMLFVGLVNGDYEPKWINENFYFDPRGFNFLVRSKYLTKEIEEHLGGKPFKSFETKQKKFESVHEVGYYDFMEANQEIDQLFIDSILHLVASKGAPIVLAIAGPTAAGKTEIVDRLRAAFEKENKKIAAIELDNFMTDRDQREERGIGSFGKEAIHFELFRTCINDILNGKKVTTPRYDFIFGTSSHDLQGKLKPGRTPIEIQPADIIFIEGNSPFLLPEIAPLVGIKVVYITDDPVRLKRKWRRDIDYRKKYDPYYLRNRYFKEQPPMAIKNYRPQLLACDIFVDTTSAAMWVTPEIAKIIKK